MEFSNFTNKLQIFVFNTINSRVDWVLSIVGYSRAVIWQHKKIIVPKDYGNLKFFCSLLGLVIWLEILTPQAFLSPGVLVSTWRKIWMYFVRCRPLFGASTNSALLKAHGAMGRSSPRLFLNESGTLQFYVMVRHIPACSGRPKEPRSSIILQILAGSKKLSNCHSPLTIFFPVAETMLFNTRHSV